MASVVWQRSADWVGQAVEDSFVMISIDTGKYVTLNKTADAVWCALEEPRTEAEIGDLLRARFAVTADECAAAVHRTLETMRDLDLASPR